MERKDFIIKLCGLACIGLSADMLTSCKSVAYVPHTTSGKKILVKKSDFGENKYVVVKTAEQPAPIYLAKTSAGYNALLMLCTHKQCELTPYGSVLHCPCHGSEFDNAGTVLNPPAQDNLYKFKAYEEGDNIIIEQ